MNQFLVKKYPSDKTDNLNFVESCFTTARFDEGNRHIQKIKSLYTAPGDSLSRLLLETFSAANHLASGNTAAAAPFIRSLIVLVKKQPPVFKTGWSFKGVNHFIRTHHALEPHRKALIALFDALDKKDRDAIVNALKQIK